MARTTSRTSAVWAAVAWGLGSACLAAGVAAQGGRFVAGLDLAAEFAPIWLAGGLAATMIGLVATSGAQRRRLVALGLLAVVASGWLVAPELTRILRPEVGPGAPGRLRLIQFNSWDENPDPNGAAAWIASQKPDLVTVEEVTPGLAAALVGRGYFVRIGFGHTAIFSRTVRLPDRVKVPRAAWARLPPMVRVRLPAPDGQGTFDLFCVHLGRPTESVPGPDVLADLLALYPRDRLILAGDFNRTPWSFSLRRLDRRLGLERRDRAIPTWPARLMVAGRSLPAPAVLPIDHVYAGAAWRTVRVARGPRLTSDHYPLVVDLALTGG